MIDETTVNELRRAAIQLDRLNDTERFQRALEHLISRVEASNDECTTLAEFSDHD